jgi:hypothetical protein
MAESSHLSSTKKVQIDIFFRWVETVRYFQMKKNTTPTIGRSVFNHNILKVYIIESGATSGHKWGATAMAVAASIKLTN